MNKIALLFPGQGSQFIGMLSEIAQQYPAQIERIFSIASQCLGYDLWQLIQEGPEAQLGQTEYTQPALLASSVALWKIWEESEGKPPAFLAGHSLGEYSALVCAEAIRFEDAITLVANRGRFMQEAVKEGQGAMAAIIGLEDALIETLCQTASEGQILSAANYNSPGQIVVSGATAAVERVIILAEENGARMAKKIPVSVPSHCDLMQPAAAKLRVVLDQIEIKSPLIPVIFNVDVQMHKNPEAIRNALIQQLYSPVRWVQIIQFLNSLEIDTMIECGPGKVLSGLNKRIVKSLQTLSIDTPESLQQALEKVSCASSC